ncbi:MAG: hypothetical protein WB683_11610 [Candidatus Sulfotelmatobacter sp.]
MLGSLFFVVADGKSSSLTGWTHAVWGRFSVRMNRMRSRSKYQHDQPEDQQCRTPSQIHIQAERALVNYFVTESAKSRQQQANYAEEQTDRQTNI